ncbi:hypothetical protein WA026_014049 [Henosepilachna vigintioctopunctata]|uniref:Uncharacterized protein n=1 Tax=Henosepilachna vigintioctopunctata TaxID=420089 RepID=A0AAW1TYJ1_9CUCU
MAQGGMDLKHQFKNFSKFGDPDSEGSTLTNTQVDRWLTQAEIIDMDTVTTTHTGVCFNKFKTRRINFRMFQDFLQDLADQVGGIMMTSRTSWRIVGCLVLPKLIKVEKKQYLNTIFCRLLK